MKKKTHKIVFSLKHFILGQKPQKQVNLSIQAVLKWKVACISGIRVIY